MKNTIKILIRNKIVAPSLTSAGRYLLCIFLGQFLIQSIKAQDVANGHNREWSAGASFLMLKEYIIDKSYSHVAYSAINPGYGISLATSSEKLAQRLELFYTEGRLPMKGNNTGDLQSSYFALDYAQTYSLYSSFNGSSSGSVGWAVRVGGSVDLIYAKRKYGGFINNNPTFEFASTLAPVLELAYFFKGRLEGLSIVEKINIPLIGYLEQPSFSGEKPMNSSQLANFSSFFSLKDCTSLEKIFAGNQKISLAYTWDYYQIRGPRPVNQANHRIGLTYSVKF